MRRPPPGRLRRGRLGLLLPLGVGLSLGLAPPAHGAPEGEWALGAAAGPALLRRAGQWRPGGQVGGEGQLGLSDTWTARAALQGGWFEGSAHTLQATAGLVWALDVVRIIPFVEAGLGLGYRGGAGGGRDLGVAVELGAGGRYLLDRRWSLGAGLRGQPLALAGAPRLLALVLQLGREL